MSGLPGYTLPADEGRHELRMRTTDNFAGRHFAKTVETHRTFASERPTTSDVDSEFSCVDEVVGDDRRPCAQQSMIFVGYKLNLADDDTAPAGRAHTITVTPRNPDPSAPPIAGVDVSASFDGGDRWQPVPASAEAGGGYIVTVPTPPLEQTNGAVSLKVETWDRNGNRVTQVISDAYGLR